MLGYALYRVFSVQNGYHLYGLDTKEQGSAYELQGYARVDITNAENVYGAVTKINPDIVIHTAAYTDVDKAETEPDLVHKINALGTRNVALACQRFDAAMVYFSTDYVFDGKLEKYQEYSVPHPLNVYGESKLQGEHYIRGLLSKFYIVRTSWLFGSNGKSFVGTILSKAVNSKSIEVVDDQTGSPTYTVHLASAVAELVGRQNPGLYGIWHITNTGSCTWYQLAEYAVKLKGINCAVMPITTKKLNRPAVRPRVSVLENRCWRVEGFKPLPSWQDGVIDYIGEVGIDE